jgi:dipeptidyl aminopeptidase/acylaminoacyl peptidase
MKVAVAIFWIGSVFAADKLTVDKAMQVREPQDLQFSPDGKRVAFLVQEPVKNRDVFRHIWVYDRDTHETRQWTTSAKSENSPRWSPDGKTLAFLSDREEGEQVYLMPSIGGEAMKLTSAKNSVQNFKWSPDGARIGFIAPEPRTEEQEKKQRDGDDQRVIDSQPPARFWTVDIANKAVKQVTNGKWVMRDFDWMPDGKHLVAGATDRPNDEHRGIEKIYSVSVDDGGFQEIVAPKGPFRSVQVSPDGKSFAFVASPSDGPQAHDLHIYSFESRGAKNITGPMKDRPVTAFQWIGNSEIAVLFSNGFHSELDAVGGKTRKLVTGDSLDVAHFSISKDGAIAYTAESSVQLPEVFADGKVVTHLNDGFKSVDLAKAELFQYKSFDGLPIEAALYRGAGARDGEPQPVVMMIHGGPAGVWRDRFDALTQLLVAKGYTVVAPNIRGSVGYGQKFLESNRGDWGGSDYKDMMAGVDDLVRRKIADPNRLAIAGWSYGGYMAEWAITQTDRFKVAVCGAGMADLATEFGTEQRPEGDEWYYQTPYENLAGFQKSSPIVYIKNAKTPTLILQGEADTTDPISQSQMLYRGLKRYNVPAEFVVYPREPHGLREQKHVADRLRRSVEWIEKYLGPAAPISASAN